MQVVVDKTLVSYRETNESAEKACLVLHGWGQDASAWVGVVKELPSDYRYILMDLPGMGGSQNLPFGANVNEYSELVRSFLNKLEIDEAIILGHSFGGQIAVDMAWRWPGLISKLILVSPAVIRKRTGKQKVKVWVYKNFSWLKSFMPERVIRKVLSLVTSSDYYGSSEELKAVLRNIVEYNLEEKIGQIKIPVKILWGDADREIPYMGKELVEMLPHGELKVLYGADHNPHLLRTEELATEITKGMIVR